MLYCVLQVVSGSFHLSRDKGKIWKTIAYNRKAQTLMRLNELIQTGKSGGQRAICTHLRRELLREHNKALTAQAYQAGVVTTEQFSTFWNFGYMGLYRERATQIRQRKGITSRQDIGDFSSSSELAQNIMKASLARDMMIARQVADPNRANATHFEAGNLVRRMLIDAGVPPPELLPTPQKSYKQLLLEQVERERLAEDDRLGLWGQIQEGAIQIDEAELSPIEFGVKITLTPKEGDTEITIVSVTAPLEEGTEYTTLHISEPGPTSISIFWSPDTPTGDLLEEALFALSDYLTEIINQDQALKSLYAGQSPTALRASRAILGLWEAIFRFVPKDCITIISGGEIRK